MIIIKDSMLACSYDYFMSNGTFNLELYVNLLRAKGINPDDKLEIIKK